MILPVIVVFGCFALSVHGKKLHEHMTKEEIESVFNVKHDSIHQVKYDMLGVYHLAERDVFMKSSTHEYRLYLNDNDVLLGSETPIYKAKYNISNNRIYYTKTFYRDYFPGSFKLYHDYKNQAAFAVHSDGNYNRHFDGVMGQSLHIRSIPERLHQELKRNYSALLEMTPDITDLPRDEFMNNSTYHVIIDKSNNAMDDAINNSNNSYELAQKNKISPSPENYETKECTVYPEILITVDYNTFGFHGWDTKNIAKYMAAFWNAVDLRYRELMDPKVKLNIAGLIISEDAFSVPNTTETKLPGDYYDAKNFIDVTNRFFVINETNTFPTDSYDVIVAMTSEQLRFNDDEKEMWKLEGRFASRGRACHHVNRIAVVLDRGSFSYVGSAAHVLSHLFGTDDDPVRSYDDCDSVMGYIMSSMDRGHNSFRWSRCSKESMKAFFNSDDSNCLKNKPYMGKLYPKILPGILLSRDEQCLRRFGRNASIVKNNQADCLTLVCQPKVEAKNLSWMSRIFGNYSVSDLWPMFSRPAEGTSCGIKRICLDGYCVEDSPLYHSTNLMWNQYN